MTVSAFSNAIGYILELKTGIKQNWFARLVEHTLESEITTIDCKLKESLYQELINPAPYTEKSVVPELPTPGGDMPFHREVLLSLKKFDNFKRLEPYLKVSLHPRATIIFGANGAGKSSLCAAFKCLAGKSHPEPLCNVYASTSKCSFEYETMNATKKWESSSPVPLLSSHIKNFDSKLALSYIDSNSDPKKYIEITPFLLHLFEILKNHLDDFEIFLNEKLSAEEQSKEKTISRCRALFGTQKSAMAKNFDAALTSGTLKPLYDYMTQIAPATIKERLSCANADYKKIFRCY